MCLGELGEVVRLLPQGYAEVRCRGRGLTVSLLTLDDPVVPGDWVLLHSGLALGRLSEQEAREAAAIRGTAMTGKTTQEERR